MPTRDSAPIGAPCWVDLMTTDVEGSRAFYGELFGWTSEEPNEQFGGYFTFSKDGVQVAGGMASQPGVGVPNVWSIYLASDDAAKTLEAVTANGGQIYAEAIQVMDLGTMAVAADPGGAAIAVWQPGSHKGFGIFAEVGAPSWFELLTRDYATSVDFYREVFHWTTRVHSDTPEFRYTTDNDGDTMLAGVMDAGGFLPEGVPNHWSVYFGTSDTDATLAKILALGGSIVTPAEDTPYGRLAAAADPAGAVFKLIAPNPANPPTPAN
jgi:uncharacterized protein